MMLAKYEFGLKSGLFCQLSGLFRRDTPGNPVLRSLENRILVLPKLACQLLPIVYIRIRLIFLIIFVGLMIKERDGSFSIFDRLSRVPKCLNKPLDSLISASKW